MMISSREPRPRGFSKAIAKIASRYSSIAPPGLLEAMQTQPAKAFRLTAKATPDTAKALEAFGIEPVQWCQGAYTAKDLGVMKSLEHFTGQIYFQDLSSMMPPLLADLSGPVLDACAAPGSKTTQLSALMGNKGVVVANDIDYRRIKALAFNVEKSGCMNVVVTNYDLTRARFPPVFSSVLVDAPCSSEGIICRNPLVANSWSESKPRQASLLQKKLALRGFDLLAPGGTLVYSTCTFAPEENEAVVDFLLGERQASVEEVKEP